MNLSQLVEIAQKVFTNREAPDDPKRTARIMVAAMQDERPGKTRARQGRSERGPRKGRASKNRCAYCKKEGQRKNECPEKNAKDQGNRKTQILVTGGED